jgi:hypothetical protein
MVATVRPDHFDLLPMSLLERCTELSVAAHALYEKSERYSVWLWIRTVMLSYWQHGPTYWQVLVERSILPMLGTNKSQRDLFAFLVLSSTQHHTR